jgi:hypothetical protein
MSIIDEYNKMMRRELPEDAFFIPLLIWMSALESNIEACQKINMKLSGADRKVLIGELTLNTTGERYIKYPKVEKDNANLQFFYRDAAQYYGWTINELKNNLLVLDLEELKQLIARAFGYDDEQRKVIGLVSMGVKNGKKHKSGRVLKKRGNDRDRTEVGTKRGKGSSEGKTQITDFG